MKKEDIEKLKQYLLLLKAEENDQINELIDDSYFSELNLDEDKEKLDEQPGR